MQSTNSIFECEDPNSTEEQTVIYGYLKHPITQTLFLAMRHNKVLAINFGVTREEFLNYFRKTYKKQLFFSPQETREALAQVESYLDGNSFRFKFTLDISMMTSFQQRVLNATLQIPYGQTSTYKEIANGISNPRAVRAVGQALGNNLIPIVIPCHRVISSNGSLGGYRGGGGLQTKKKLLQLEGVHLV